MPYSFNIHTVPGVIDVRCWGEFTAEECLALLAEIHRHPDYRPGFHTLSDCRELSRAFTPHELERVMAAINIEPSERGGARTAIVVAGDVQFGMSRMFQASSESRLGLTTQVFRDMNEARHWLGADL